MSATGGVPPSLFNRIHFVFHPSVIAMSLPVKSEADGPEDFQWADACIPEDDVLPGHAGCRCAAGECQRGTCACATAVLTRDAQVELCRHSAAACCLRLHRAPTPAACQTVLPLPLQGLVTVLPTTEPAGLELTECGPLCACFGSCGLGFTAAAAAVPPISLRRSEGKGWGVFADEPLPAGLVVCHYAGEYVSNAEAQRRLAQYDEAGGGHALLVRGWARHGEPACGAQGAC